MVDPATLHLFVGSGSANVVTALIPVLAKPTVQGILGSFVPAADGANTSTRRVPVALVNALFPISCIPAFMAPRSVASWLLPARFDVFARDPGKLTMPCLIVTKYHALRGSTFSSAA